MQSEQKLKISKNRLTYLFNRLYLYDDELSQSRAIQDIMKCVVALNKAQSVVDRSYRYDSSAIPELIAFANAWNELYIPRYVELLDSYYAQLNSYNINLFNTSWKDTDQINLIRSQYALLRDKCCPDFYKDTPSDAAGDYFCIRDFIIGRDRDSAVDFMKRRVRSKGIFKVNSIMNKLHCLVGNVVDYSLVEDTDGISGIVIGEGKRAKLETRIYSFSTAYGYTFDAYIT